MKKNIFRDIPVKGRITVLFILSSILIALSAFFGELPMPFAAGLYAVLLFSELEAGKRTPIFSLTGGILSLLLSALAFSPVVIFAPASVIIGIAVYLMYRFGMSKCDTSVLLTLLGSAVIILYFVLIAFEATGIYTLDGAVEYYIGIYEFIKTEFVKYFDELYYELFEGTVEGLLTTDLIEEAFDTFIKVLPTMIMLIAFIFAGITLKLFTAVMRKLTDETERIHRWSFRIPSLYAYFYIAVYILSVFVTADSALGLAVLNLSGFMLFMFAYMGLKFTNRILKDKGHPKMAVLLPLFGILLLANFAVELLSVFGVFYTVYESKNGKNANPFNHSNTDL